VTPPSPPRRAGRAGLYKALFLDVGETLVYAHPSSAEVMATVLAEGGLDVSPAAIEAVDGRVWSRVQARQAELQAASPDGAALYSVSAENSERFWAWVYDVILGTLGILEESRPDLARRLHARFSALETWRLYPDALPFLREIEGRRGRDGLVVGVVSNWEDWLEALLISLEVHHYFDFLVASAGVRSEKPHPAIFRAALERAGTRPEETLHVGDSLTADVGGARASGIVPVLLDRRGRYTPDEAAGATIIRSLEELPALLDAEG
jgi:putative hydrolase of the HAD superfamily